MFKDLIKLKLSPSIKDILRIPFYKVYDTLFSHDQALLKRNSVLKNKYDGERCFLMLTGESISHIDLELLREEYSFGVGFLFLHPQINQLKLTFSLAAEVDEWMDKLGSHGSCNWPENHIRSNGVNQGYVFLKKVFDILHANGTTIFLNHDHINYYKRIQLFNLNDEKVFYLRLMSHLHKENNPVLDLTKRFVGGGGSIHDAILILTYMGFKEIYLCGAGYTYDPVYELHFYDNYLFPKSMGRKEAELEARKAVDAHGGEMDSTLEYYGLFEKDDFYRCVCISKNDYGSYRDKHRILNNYAKSRGVKIYNIVPDGFESPVYEKITWQEVKDNSLSINPDKI